MILSVFLIGEQEDGTRLLAEDGVNAVLVEVDETGIGLALDESLEAVDVGITRVLGHWLVKVAEDNNACGLKTEITKCAHIISVEELPVVGDGTDLGGSLMEIELLAFEGSNVSDGLLDVALESLKLVASDEFRRGSGLLLDPRQDGVLSPATSVLLLLSVANNSLIWFSWTRVIQVIIILTGKS